MLVCCVVFIKCSLIKNFTEEIERFKRLAVFVKAFPRAWSQHVESVLTAIVRQLPIPYPDIVWWAGNSHHLTASSSFSTEVRGWLVGKAEGLQGLPASQGRSVGTALESTVVPLPVQCDTCLPREGLCFPHRQFGTFCEP